MPTLFIVSINIGGVQNNICHFICVFDWAKLKPVPSPVNWLYGFTESARPPVSRTTGTGFSFANQNADEMADIILYAADVYRNDKQAWENLVKQAMAEDFSWHNAANEYLDVYHLLHPEIIRYVRRRDW